MGILVSKLNPQPQSLYILLHKVIFVIVFIVLLDVFSPLFFTEI